MRSVNINEPGQGLADGVLDDCHVLIWWGHVRHAEITPETGQSIVKKITEGKLSLHRDSLGPLVNAVRRSHESSAPGSTSLRSYEPTVTSGLKSATSRLIRGIPSRNLTHASPRKHRGASFPTAARGRRSPYRFVAFLLTALTASQAA